MKLVAIQMTSTDSVEQNLAVVGQQLQQLSFNLANSVVVLPECFANFGGAEQRQFQVAEFLGKGPIQRQLADWAKQYQIYIVAGSMPIKSPDYDKLLPCALVFAPNGELITHYQKIHLFDVEVNDGTGSYQESKHWQAGSSLCYFDTPQGRVGVVICYDLRFPALFQALRKHDIDIVVVPSAFTQKTGEAHWQTLLTARAIENQIYVVGCNQQGQHLNGRETYGHSMIIDPWGTVLSSLDQGVGVVSASVDLPKLAKIRQQMPVFTHNKLSYLK